MADLSRASALWREGRRAEAERAVEALLGEAPDDRGALRALAEIYAATGRAANAVEIGRRLLGQQPDDAETLRQLAQSLLANRQSAEAIDTLRHAIRCDPGNPRAYNNLGLAQMRAGDPRAAVISLRQAVEIDPRYALGFMNLGLAQSQAGLPTDAQQSLEQALRLDPHLIHARTLLGDILRKKDAAAARKQDVLALESHAINLMTVRRHEDAIRVWTQLINDGAGVRYAEASRFHCQLHCCDWTDYAATSARLQSLIARGQGIDRPFSFFVYCSSVELQLRCSQAFVADNHPPIPSVPPEPRALRNADGRIRIAYLSFDFQEHATSYLLAGLLEAHDRSRFEISAISYGEDDHSPMRVRLEAAVDRFIDVSHRTDEEVAGLIRDLGIQIAVDLKGFTGGARTGIFARRAAPLQINFLGYPGTMGADYIDYIIADRHVVPPSDQRCYSEGVVYMPSCYQPNDVRRPRPERLKSRGEHGLPERGFVFCSFNNSYKITPMVFDVWMDLLRGVQHSVLWLMEGGPAAVRNLRSSAAAAGVDPERLLFAPYVPLAQHLERYRHADLFLDTIPCNAHTTASDALWMGVPVLTVTGSAFAGRVATSLLHAVGLPQLCHRTLAGYSAHAQRLARSPDELDALKAHLERETGAFPLFDSAAYCRHLESAFESMWKRAERGEPAGALTVAP